MSEDNKIQELYDSGMSMRKISKELEIPYKEVRDTLNSEQPLQSTQKPEDKELPKVPEIKNRVPKAKALEIFEKKKTAGASPGISAIVR